MKTVSFELSKQLYKTEIKIDSQFNWYGIEHYQGEQEPAIELFTSDQDLESHIKDAYKLYPAPTTDELLEWLPDKLNTFLDLYRSSGNVYHAGYEEVASDLEGHYETADTPVEALAKLALWVAKNRGEETQWLTNNELKI